MSQLTVGRLALEDGTLFRGRAFGACGDGATTVGEVVFNTAMTGYQEALTDPSYSGQILTMTAPQIGNYGIAADDDESARPQVAGFVVRELSRVVSNQRAVVALSDWLERAGILGISAIDTRALVRHLRSRGALRGALSCDVALSDASLVDRARTAPVMSGQDLASRAGATAASSWSDGLGEWAADQERADGTGLRVLALDCGAKRNILRHLAARGCRVEIVPLSISADEVRAANPDGLFVSNGPGDPAAVTVAVDLLRRIAGTVPTFGICLGHQLLALALGATTWKLPFGHRGANQPVRNVLTGRVEITSQNHGFCVDAESLAALDCEVTHVHLNDGTVAGFRHRSLPIFSVQHHPEASPGPHDASYLFDCFIEMMRTGRPVDAAVMREAQNRATTGARDAAAAPSA